MKPKSLNELKLEGSTVIVRGDLDVDVVNGVVAGDARLNLLMPTLNAIYDNGANKIVLIGHRGRPLGKPDKDLGMDVIADYFRNQLTPETILLEHQSLVNFEHISSAARQAEVKLVIVDNLRFWAEETEGNEEFAQKLSTLGDYYVNDAFAASHRTHTSIALLPKHFVGTKAAGLRLTAEIEALNKVTHDPVRPLIVIISGLKKDKLSYLDYFKAMADKVLVGGRLPEYLPEDYSDSKVLVARLTPEKNDITIHSIEQFEQEIAHAGTIVVSGPIGKYEDPGFKLGTERIFRFITDSHAFTVAGGGDTEQAFSLFGIKNQIDWISVGGGAMLEFLARGTLPGIEALLN